MTTTQTDALPGVLHKLPKGKRLEKSGVMSLLKDGRRLSSRAFEVWAAKTPDPVRGKGSRVAIAVSKRLLASAVARNRIKRVSREVFRAHRLSGGRLDVLVKYRLRSDARNATERAQIREELGRLLSKVASAASV